MWLRGFRLHFGYNPRDGQKTETQLFKVDVLMLVVVFGLGSPMNFSSASCIDKERPVAVQHLYPAHQPLLSSPLTGLFLLNDSRSILVALNQTFPQALHFALHYL